MAPIGSDESGNDDSGTEESESDSTETEISFGPGENSSLAGYLKEMKATLGVSEITITSGTGAVQATTDPTVKTSVVDPDGVSFDRARTGIYFAPIQRDKAKKYFTHVLGSVTDSNGSQHLIHVKLDLEPAYKILSKYYGLGRSGEVILARQDVISKKVALVSPLRENPEATISLRDPKDKFVLAFSPVFEGKSITSVGADYRGVNVLQTSRKIEKPNLALIAKIDLDEANGQASELVSTFIYAGICIAALATLVAMVFARSFTQPLYS